MVYIQRRETFSASHRLHNADWSDAQNEAVFGKCANENWHGHNFELFVTVKGEANPETGFVMDAKLLSKIIKDKVWIHSTGSGMWYWSCYKENFNQGWKGSGLRR